MINKCIAPGCKECDHSSEKTVINFWLILQKKVEENYALEVSYLNWMPSNNSVLCVKHFEESCS